MKKSSPLFTRGLAVSCRWISCAALLAAIHASSAQSSDSVRFTVRQMPVPAAQFEAKAADFNGDGKQDLALLTFNSGVEIYLGYGNGKFSKPTEYPYPDGAYGSDLTIGDFDGDGSPDLVVCTSSNVAVYFNNGHGEFSPPTLLPNVGGYAAAGDFNRDGHLDLAVVSGADTVSVFLGDGTGGFAPPIVFSTGAKSSGSVVAADFDGDGILDLAIIEYEDLDVGIFYGNGDGNFSSGRFFASTSANPLGFATGDFNRDGKADLAVSDDISGGRLDIFLGNGNRTLTRGADLFLSTEEVIVIGDFNGDGNPDIVTDTTSEPSALKIALGDGTGNFGVGQTISYPTGTGRVLDLAAADFNGDGKLDMASAQDSAADGTFDSLIFLNHPQRSRGRH